MHDIRSCLQKKKLTGKDICTWRSRKSVLIRPIPAVKANLVVLVIVGVLPIVAGSTMSFMMTMATAPVFHGRDSIAGILWVLNASPFFRRMFLALVLCIPKKAHNVQTVQTNRLPKRTSYLLERNKARPDGLTFFQTSFHNFSLSLQFSLTTSLSFVTARPREKGIPCCDTRPLSSNPATRPHAYPGNSSLSVFCQPNLPFFPIRVRIHRSSIHCHRSPQAAD